MVPEAGGGATYYQDRLRRWAYRCDAGGARLLRGMMDKATPLLEGVSLRLGAMGGSVASEGEQIYAQKPNLRGNGITWSQENYAHLGLQVRARARARARARVRARVVPGELRAPRAAGGVPLPTAQVAAPLPPPPPLPLDPYPYP